jgi:hypothetical protein
MGYILLPLFFKWLMQQYEYIKAWMKFSKILYRAYSLYNLSTSRYKQFRPVHSLREHVESGKVNMWINVHDIKHEFRKL